MYGKDVADEVSMQRQSPTCTSVLRRSNFRLPLRGPLLSRVNRNIRDR